MKTEVPILLAMGYEVFIPKIIPDDRSIFRTGSVDYKYDEYLTLPYDVMDKLNSTDFYTKWPDDVVKLMNEYFATVFIMPMHFPLENGLKRFQGAVLLRRFGLEEAKTYANVLTWHHKDSLKWIYAIRERFWFASGYQQLSEVEPNLLSERNIFLPISLPASFETHKDTWTGIDKHIVFVCPNIRTIPYYAKIYEEFKRYFGDLPHVILGIQCAPVDDPNVLGFVSDDEFVNILQRSAVMYYHSREPRHVHYSPIEAAQIGTPVVLYQDNLLARMIGHKISGAVGSVAEARAKIVAILEGDALLIESIRNDQRVLHKLFSESYCLEIWKTSFLGSGLSSFLDNIDIASSVCDGEEKTYQHVPRRLLLRPDVKLDTAKTLQDGIEFQNDAYPWFVDYIEGLAPPETWGTWSNGHCVEIGVSIPLHGAFELEITGGAYGDNAMKPVAIEIGDATNWVEFPTPPWEPTTVRTSFDLVNPAHTIKIHVPFPTVLAGSQCAIGVGVIKIAVHALHKNSFRNALGFLRRWLPTK